MSPPAGGDLFWLFTEWIVFFSWWKVALKFEIFSSLGMEIGGLKSQNYPFRKEN